MEDKTIENEIRWLEEQYWQAMKEQDVEAAVELTEFPCLVIGPRGARRVEQHAFEKMLADSSYAIRSFEMKPSEVRMLTDEVAVIAYEIHEQITANGKDSEVDSVDCSTWVKRNGQWRCAAHSETLKR